MRARSATLALSLALSLAGCSAISDFDFTFSDEDAGPDMDGGARDAGPEVDAAGIDAGPDIDAGPGVDGGPPPPRCPAPCVGDALTDFMPAQGNGALDWRYHEDTRAPLGTDYPELTFGTYGGLMGHGATDGAPLVGDCRDATNAGEPECAGLGDHLLVIPDPPSGDGDAAISFAAAARGVLRVQGRVRLPDGVAGGETVRVTVSRNTRPDFAYSTELVPTAAPTDFDGEVDVLPGDRVIVTFEQRTGAMAMPLGVQLWVTRMGAPVDDRCLVGVLFDRPNELRDVCDETDVANLTDGIGSPPGPSTRGASPSPWLGDGREFEEGQYIRIGNRPTDLSGDFTISFWGRPDPSQRFDGAFLANSTSDAPPGGVSVGVDTSLGPDVRTFWQMTSACTETQPGICIAFERLGSDLMAGEWHYYRVSRTTGDDRMRACVDGQERAVITVPGTANLTGPYRFHLGRNVVFNPAYFEGALDDVRVYEVALPCER